MYYLINTIPFPLAVNIIYINVLVGYLEVKIQLVTSQMFISKASYI